MLWYIRLYNDLFTSSNGIISLEADIKVSIYSNPVGVGSELVMLGKGNNPPSGVNPRNAVYRSSFEKLFWYNLTPNSLIASETMSFDTPCFWSLAFCIHVWPCLGSPCPFFGAIGFFTPPTSPTATKSANTTKIWVFCRLFFFRSWRHC